MAIVSCTNNRNNFVTATKTAEGYKGYPYAQEAFNQYNNNSNTVDYSKLSVPHGIRQFDENDNFIGALWGTNCKHPLDISTTDVIGNCPQGKLCIPDITIPNGLKDLINDLVSKDSITWKTVEDINKLAEKVDTIPEARTLITILSQNYANLPEQLKEQLSTEIKDLILDYTLVQTPDKEPDYNDLSAYLNAPFPELKLQEQKDNDELNKLLKEIEKLGLENFDIPVIEPSNKDITDRSVNGEGVFDYIASSIYNQLEYTLNKGLITKNDVANMYSNFLVQGIQSAMQFALEKHNITIASYNAKVSAVQASVAVLQAKAELLMLPAKMRLAYAQIEAQLQQIELLKVQTELEKEKFPQIVAQTDLILAQTDGQRLFNDQTQVDIQTKKLNIERVKEEIELSKEQNIQAKVQTKVAKLGIRTAEEQIKQLALSNNKLIEDTKLVDAQVQLGLKQVELADLQKIQAQAQIKALAQQAEREKENLALAKAQVATAYVQISALKEQIKASKAQYSDTIDGHKIGGVIGAQIAVNKAQAMGFERSAVNNFLNQLQSGWSAKKTADIAITSPNGFTALGLDRVLNWTAINYFNMPQDIFEMPAGYSDYLTDDQMDNTAATGNAGLQRANNN